LRDVAGGLLGRTEQDLGELGWDRDGQGADLRFEIERLPVVEGRFQFNVSLMDAARTRRYHSVEKAAEFTVVPQGEARGFVLFEGQWSLEQAAPVVEADSASKSLPPAASADDEVDLRTGR
jgi:hypothetical protein